MGLMRDQARPQLIPASTHARLLEPVACAETMIAGLDTVTVTRADLRDPDVVLQARGVVGLLDLSRPVALLAGTRLLDPGSLTSSTGPSAQAPTPSGGTGPWVSPRAATPTR